MQYQQRPIWRICIYTILEIDFIKLLLLIASLPQNHEQIYSLQGSLLENLDYRFNNEHSADYRHLSMSVGDIVAIERDCEAPDYSDTEFAELELLPNFDA